MTYVHRKPAVFHVHEVAFGCHTTTATSLQQPEYVSEATPRNPKRRYISDNEVFRQLCGNAPRTIMPELHHGDIHASTADEVPEAFAEYYRHMQDKFPVLTESQVENLEREFMYTVPKNSRKLTKLDCRDHTRGSCEYFSSVKVKCCGGPDGLTPFIWKTLCSCPSCVAWMTEVFNVAFWIGSHARVVEDVQAVHSVQGERGTV